MSCISKQLHLHNVLAFWQNKEMGGGGGGGKIGGGHEEAKLRRRES